ncbi:WecB/TagA/CpsF family glycosyltransferase [Ancylobacter sp. MQZ15Z-1]|uniref:WecB/TagA/CpsF family glycosyltransferase n=1 Tax=Ancylobacter mangrovi TaxID=2972472 RepID=A0A9X2PCI1_9HYPH|nr:WecB/TagA/CpsF family glycosyltransferase [Ancylobacter mangrovi]MCS0496121.1 WecB/TagA/CpsF family glycosyltransferase [Ancylobacter mangrovi]
MTNLLADPADGAAGRPADAVDEAVYLGVPIARLDTAGAAARIAARAPGLPFAYVVTPNAAHFTRLIRLRDARFREAVSHAWLRLLDGHAPHVLAKRLFGLDLPLAPGSDVTALLLQRHLRRDDPVTVIGGGPGLREAMIERFGLVDVAQHEPPMGFIDQPAAVEACVDFVLEHPARYVFLVTGAPQSEYLALRIAERGGAVGCGLCVGSALNFATGRVPRAPRFLRRAGLEWAYRLMRNPLGHARRVFVDSLPILAIALQARLDPAAFGMAGDGLPERGKAGS